MTKKKLIKWADHLEQHGKPFMKAYTKLCKKHSLIVRDGIGGAMEVAQVTEREVEKNEAELQKSIDVQIVDYRELIELKGGRTPYEETFG